MSDLQNTISSCIVENLTTPVANLKRRLPDGSWQLVSPEEDLDDHEYRLKVDVVFSGPDQALSFESVMLAAIPGTNIQLYTDSTYTSTKNKLYINYADALSPGDTTKDEKNTYIYFKLKADPDTQSPETIMTFKVHATVIPRGAAITEVVDWKM